MQKDSVGKTFLVAGVLCVLCSILVAGSAVVLKDKQDANKVLDIKKNLLMASGLISSSKVSVAEIDEAYKKIKPELVDLETGEVTDKFAPENFNQRKAAKTPELSKKIEPSKDLGGIKARSKYSIAYKVIEDGEVKMLILPVNGKGLWSTLYGFIALSPDTQEVKGIGFYQHGETPGLGAEVDNPSWKAQWKGKKVYGAIGDIALKVKKGSVQSSDPGAEHMVDGLSGATITSNGVTGLVRYWLGEDGFGPYLEKQKALASQEASK